MASNEEGQVFACHTDEQWKQYLDLGLESKKLVVADFTATWCPPCRFIAPIFAESAKTFAHVIFLKVNVDELQSISKEYEIEAMPTFLFFKEGKEVHRIVGADKDALRTKITSLAVL